MGTSKIVKMNGSVEERGQNSSAEGPINFLRIRHVKIVIFFKSQISVLRANFFYS